MAGMLFVLFAVAALLTSRCSCAGPSYPELNPALGKYQNPSQCMPIQEKWYAVYRNYENDPAFGGTAKCAKFTSLGPEENGVYTMLVQFTDTSITVVTNLTSYEGYDVDNLQYFHALGQDDSVLLYIAYLDCQECVVFRNSYITDDACTLLVPESALEKHTCCDFIFDLLCGTTPKYYIYDESCAN
ncbi:uncharacterized protein LOC120849242 [Ixodes scapularis]|uniref:uncharacterized protein LOC120849242 n=1 Tax=Ixodes scapularis TaxID=6945 RepID=UPI001A9E3AAA|nr:uncharacterized protein LOC120849242 [Ixodes scapularis]